MPKVKFVAEKQEIEVPAGANLRQEALKAGIQLYPGINRVLNCRGLGSCGTCRVLVKGGMDNVSPPGLKERVRLFMMPFATIGHEKEMRLACQVQVNGDCTIETKPTFNMDGDNFWQKPYPNK